MSRPRVHIRSLVAAAALSVVLAGARTAHATCGDWLTMDHAAAPHATPQTPDATDEQPARSPCRGPRCSQGSGVPAAPAPHSSTPVPRWACVPEAAPSAEPCEGESLAERSAPRPPRRPSGVFRPPR